jgi:diguanylate cyclase (GGDEF)-like protein
VRLGAATTAVCALAGVGYALGTPEGPHRGAVLALGLVALVTSPLIVTRRVLGVLTGPGRDPWLYGWSASLLLTVTLAVGLDGGAASPLSALFFASLVFTASGYGRRGALVLGVVQIGCYLLTCLIGSPGSWNAVLHACCLGVLAAICATTSGRLRAALAAQDTLAARLRDQAARDGLTGCLNHRAFSARLVEEVALARRSGSSLALVLLDLDDFKAVNDRYGHVAGDELLAALGDVLRSAVRGRDVAGRLGGDEFAVLVPGADQLVAADVASRVQAAVSSVGAALNVGVSVGVAVLGDEYDARELRQRADEALYADKRANRRGTDFLLGTG